ncbi:2-amino-4-hydroxy-6-hydroxymethyldihydropteridine diphosphokinase [Nevskia sp.]|uniref:2-amino-4-hydroxy-6- hydroxymethyldihydropteridine diphosphokinase n=1 Tax=Nevskia sp. TaxID=1929292 RepID=UPI0025D2B93C|nr:2-amino-4-hydroxy-6-hydroxymethyldihydropteridine diphosphokinase [Nevskia sp.]
MRVYLGLGANLGTPAVQVERALALIAALPHTTLVARSPLYRSDPVGPAGQPDYCNAACMIDTALEPLALLDAVQAIEVDAGRIRDGIRWAARLLDIDLLHIEGLSLSTPRLRLPHPHLQERNWVLVPLADFAPTLDIPGLGIVAELAAAIGQAGLRPWS